VFALRCGLGRLLVPRATAAPSRYSLHNELRELGYAFMRTKRMSYMDLYARNMPPYFSAEQTHPGRRGATNGTGFSWVFGACTSSLRLMVQVLGEGQYGFKRCMRKLKQ
jgi:hypothetical protein